MSQPADLARQVLRLEQQLEAYQKLHQDELAELRRALCECKRAIVDLLDQQATNAGPARLTLDKYRNIEEEKGGPGTAENLIDHSR